MQTLTVPPELDGMRADRALAKLRPDISRSAFAGLIGSGAVTVNAGRCDKHRPLHTGDIVSFTLPEPEPLAAKPQDIPLDIVYEDEDVIVVNKPQGMVVHPAAGHYEGTLVNALLYHCAGSLSGINGVLRPGIVHRIDKNTSGLIVAAKNDAAHRSLAAQLKEHSCTRVYEAVAVGRIKDDSGVIDAPIGRNPAQRKKMAVVEGGRRAVTHYEVVARYQGYTRLRLRLETGRTHQIRVHLAHIGHPIAGDEVYGKAAPGLSGQCLHAGTIGFRHPRTGRYMEFKSPLPEYFTAFLSGLGEPTA